MHSRLPTPGLLNHILSNFIIYTASKEIMTVNDKIGKDSWKTWLWPVSRYYSRKRMSG
jgi:hypothetical protein